MIMITLVLFANIWVLRVYFKEGTPPYWVEKIYRLCSRKKGREVRRIHVVSAENPYPILKSTASVGGIEMTETANRGIPTPDEHYDKMEVQHPTWQMVSTKMDRVFFVIFITITLIAYSIYVADAL